MARVPGSVRLWRALLISGPLLVIAIAMNGIWRIQSEGGRPDRDDLSTPVLAPDPAMPAAAANIPERVALAERNEWWHQRGLFDFTLGETTAFLRQDRDNSNHARLSLVLSGGALKSLCDAVAYRNIKKEGASWPRR